MPLLVINQMKWPENKTSFLWVVQQIQASEARGGVIPAGIASFLRVHNGVKKKKNLLIKLIALRGEKSVIESREVGHGKENWYRAKTHSGNNLKYTSAMWIYTFCGGFS